MIDRAAERRRLSGYIDGSRRVQRRLALVLGPLGAAGVALALWRPLFGGLVVLAAVIVAICGFWVTAAHISDWRMQIQRIDRLEREGRGRTGQPGQVDTPQRGDPVASP